MAAETYQTVRKAALILDVIGACHSDGMRAAEIEREVHLGTSTTVRLLSSLENLGLVRKVEDQQYVIGDKVFLLSSQGLNHNPIFRESRMLCQQLAQETGFNANVAQWDGEEAFYLCHFEGKLSPKSRAMVGMSLPMHASGIGKCLMMDMSEQQRRDLLGDELHPYTSHTVTDHQQLTERISEAHRRGYAIENQELAYGRMCVAAPIRDSSSQICAALSLSGRLSIMTREGIDELAEQTVEIADRISVNLGMLGGAV
ncbi:MAG: IclR family transcriptional regulator [Bifidobacteriaceae bacterium]|jgi:DNA-binding IclR family transcriptional regulator|nr:IclR family transcriptional regulator [Bifidobacteriaceae bacterium]